MSAALSSAPAVQDRQKISDLSLTVAMQRQRIADLEAQLAGQVQFNLRMAERVEAQGELLRRVACRGGPPPV